MIKEIKALRISWFDLNECACPVLNSTIHKFSLNSLPPKERWNIAVDKAEGFLKNGYYPQLDNKMILVKPFKIEFLEKID